MNTYLGTPDLAAQRKKYQREQVGMWIARVIVWTFVLTGMWLAGRFA